jgi:UDP-2,3-diacylglucosamine pyrophosphatase LpxH
MFDAIIVSDIHLGSDTCQAKHLGSLLRDIVEERIQTATLILNGDVFESFDFRRLTRRHWKILSLLRKLSNHIDIIWISGNHDGSAEIVSHLLGVTVKEEYVFWSGDSRILVLHGHTFDDWLDEHPILTIIADWVYYILQKLDGTHQLARWAKHESKTFIRCVQKIEAGAIERARKLGCQAVCCGHTHHADAKETEPIQYFNSGCWTEMPCTYLAVENGRIELRNFVGVAVPEPEEAEPVLPMALSAAE